VIPANLLFWCLAGVGLVALWLGRWEARAKFFVTGFMLASFLAVFPGFYFRQHYFIVALPPVALLCGVAIGSARQALERFVRPGAAAILALGLLAVPIGVYAAKESYYLFSMSTRELIRAVYAANPFIEAVDIAKYIRERTTPDDRIAVIGSEPEIYFYADRKAATGYIYTYPLMEPQPYAKRMQQEMIREIEAAHPRFMVFSWVNTSWLLREDSDQGIIDWAKQYVRQCYDPVGVADIFSPEETRMVWGEAAKDYVGTSPNLVYTLQRKSDAPCGVSR
jgi:hypothetical protein